MACQCLNSIFLRVPFPRCSYYISRGHQSMLLTCSFSCLFFSNPRMEISLSLWTYPCDAMTVIPPQLYPFCVVFSLLCLRPALCSCCSLSTVGRLVGATLSSPISAPFFTAPQRFFPLFVYGQKTSETFFYLLKKSS